VGPGAAEGFGSPAGREGQGLVNVHPGGQGVIWFRTSLAQPEGASPLLSQRRW
jgi:hypothetical protein